VFARELHDDTLQSLYAIGMVIDGACRKNTSKPDELLRVLMQIVPEINRIIASLRIALAGLESHHSDPARLRQVLLRMLDTLSKPAGLNVATSLDVGALALLNRTQAFHLLRFTREVITNTVKHAQAKNLSMELKQADSFVELTVSDDGIGLPTDAVQRGGNGLENLQRRADAMKAFLLWEHPNEGGLKMKMKIPIHEEQEP